MNLKPIKRIILLITMAYATSHTTENQEFLQIRAKEQSLLEWALQQLPAEIIDQIPAIIQPKDDVDGRNEIKEVYYTVTPNDKALKIEYNIVFKKESYPIGILSHIQDLWHSIANGRKEDIETIEMYFENNILKAVGFPDTYSDGQKYSVKIPKHKTATILPPVMDIYVNTWNHLFSEKDTNASLEKYAWKLIKNGSELIYRCANGLEAKLIPGSREAAEQESKGQQR